MTTKEQFLTKLNDEDLNTLINLVGVPLIRKLNEQEWERLVQILSQTSSPQIV